MPNRVVDHVVEGAFQQRSVGGGDHVGRLSGGDDRIGWRIDALQRRGDDRADARRRQVDGESADLQPARVEQVPDEPVQTIGLLLDGGVRLVDLFGTPLDRVIAQP